MSLANKSSISASSGDSQDVKEKILRSVIVAMDDPEIVLKVVNEVLMSEFDVWGSIMEKSMRKTKDAFKEKHTETDAKEFNSILVKKVVEEVNQILTEFKCFMEGCVIPVDVNAGDHAIRLPDQLSKASNKPLDQCYVVLGHNSVSRFYKHLWMQEKNDRLCIEVQRVPVPSLSSYASSSGESEDIVDDVSESGESSDQFESNLIGSTSMQAVEGNNEKDDEDMKSISKSGTLNNAPCLGNGTSTGPQQLVLKRKRGQKAPIRKQNNRYYCSVSNCPMGPDKSWSTSMYAWHHYAYYHDDGLLCTKPCSFCDKKFPTSGSLKLHERVHHKNAVKTPNEISVKKELIININRMPSDSLHSVDGDLSSEVSMRKKKVLRRRRKRTKVIKAEGLPIQKRNGRFFCLVAECDVSKSWSSEFGVSYHLANQHSNEKFNSIPCDECDRKFPTSLLRNRHKIYTHKQQT